MNLIVELAEQAAKDAWPLDKVEDKSGVLEELRGVIGPEDLLRFSLPEHLLWMNDLSPILNFQPFAELLRKDQETRVADFMREEPLVVSPETPAMELARLFITRGVPQILVAEGRKLLGIVNLKEFTSQIFWA